MASKQSYVHTHAKEPLDHRIIPRIVDDQAREHPQREAVVFYDENGQRSSLTYLQLRQNSLALAASLLRLGLRPHDRAIITAHNSLEFLLCLIAMTRIAVNPLLVPLGTRQESLLAMVTRFKCRAFVGHPRTKSDADVEFISMVTKAMSAPSSAEKPASVILIAEEFQAKLPGVFLFAELLQSGETLDATEVLQIQETIQMDDEAVVVFTSGSTGDPKPIQHTHHGLVNAGLVSARCGFLIGRNENGEKTPEKELRLFNDRPFYWAACLGWGIMTALTTGNTIVTLPTKKTVREGDVAFVLKILQDEKITHALLMPYLVHDILAMGTAKFDLSALQFGILTGQPIVQRLIDDLLAILSWCTIAAGYGMTEMFPNGFQHFHWGCHSSVQDGMFVPDNNEVKIVNDDDRVVPVGIPGEICLRGPSRFVGFLEDPGETSKVLSSTGWLHTGDIGVISDQERLRICGRKSDTIKRATSKIHPAEIEKVLCQHPQIKGVIVVGVPDQRLYEELCACVIVKDGVELKMAELEEWEEKQWQGYQDEQGLTLKPRYNIFMEKFPLKDTGKIDRRSLRLVAMEKLDITED